MMDASNCGLRRRWLVIAVALLLALVAPVLQTEQASAHPLGNFTVNQYSRIEVTTDGLRVVYVLDMAEIPAFQEIQTFDADGDGGLSQTEQDALLATTLPEITRNLNLNANGQAVPLSVAGHELTFPDGQAGLKLLRLRAEFVPTTAIDQSATPLQVSYRNDFDADRLGWKEILVANGAGITLDAPDIATTDISNELRAYPEDLLQSPLDLTEASFGFTLQSGAPASPEFTRFANGEASAAPTTETSRPGGGATGARFASLLNGDNLTTTGILVALLLAAVWGAAHALSPGHGKTVVGAYLVGSRGTPKHAVFLGLTVTITHTAGVLALGLVTLFASQYILPERLFPWMSVLSGLLVVAMGLFTLRQRLRGEAGFGHHHHDHSHDHQHDGMITHTHGGSTHSHMPPTRRTGEKVTWRALLALGVSGGLIPCPSALVVLLGSIALGRVGFGLALVVAFSLGLAFTLTGLGLIFLYAGRYLERKVKPSGRMLTMLQYGPAVGSVVLTLAGVAIIVRAIEQTGLR
jgi:ABC-type nickel/cobalt efflux system permease component RcnA